jgi:hypothetical protein
MLRSKYLQHMASRDTTPRAAAAGSHAVPAEAVHALAAHGVAVGFWHEHHAVTRCEVCNLQQREGGRGGGAGLRTSSTNDGSCSGGGAGCFFTAAAGCAGRANPLSSLPTYCHMPVADTAGAGASAAATSMLWLPCRV